MNSGIGAPGGNHRAAGPRQAEEGGLHLTLDRTAPGLELPPVKIGSVVMDGQPESAFLIWVHADKVEKRGYTSRKGWTSSRCSWYP